MVAHRGGDRIKLCDFGLARRIRKDALEPLEFGMPEYVGPEVVNREGVGYEQDLWSMGIISYILLSGHSPFKGKNDRETLINIREGQWQFQGKIWNNVSPEARDFISRLLVYNPLDRMDVQTALKHPWFDIITRIIKDEFLISTDSLRNYYNQFK